MCGEKPIETGLVVLMKGSPPRVRGKEQEAQAKDRQRGITPACAGKSPGKAFRSPDWWDHPRVCGEKTKKIP